MITICNHSLDEPVRVWYNIPMKNKANVIEVLESDFSDEQKCIDYLYRLRWENGWQCPRCSYNKHWKVGDMKYKCKKCGYQSTLISGTLLQRSHLPISKWLQAAWHVASEKGCVNALGMQKTVGIGSNRTALAVLRVLRTAISMCKEPKLQGEVILDACRIRAIPKGHYSWFYIAVEVREDEYTQVRIQEHDTSKYSLFIHNCIEKDSTINTDDSSPYPIDSNSYVSAMIKRKSSVFAVINEAENDISDRLSNSRLNFESQENYDLYLGECLFKINRRNESVESIFEEILRSAVRVKKCRIAS